MLCKKMTSLFAPFCLTADSFSFFLFFPFSPPLSLSLTNSFQWLSNWKMEMLLLPSISVAASWQQSNFLSSGINGIEQYILIKKEPMIAGLPVCHLSTKSSPSRQTTMLSDLIMSRIRLREGEKMESNAHFEPLFVAHKKYVCGSFVIQN